jgi:hypothetical protein
VTNVKQFLCSNDLLIAIDEVQTRYGQGGQPYVRIVQYPNVTSIIPPLCANGVRLSSLKTDFPHIIIRIRISFARFVCAILRA